MLSDLCSSVMQEKTRSSADVCRWVQIELLLSVFICVHLWLLSLQLSLSDSTYPSVAPPEALARHEIIAAAVLSHHHLLRCLPVAQLPRPCLPPRLPSPARPRRRCPRPPKRPHLTFRMSLGFSPGLYLRRAAVCCCRPPRPLLSACLPSRPRLPRPSPFPAQSTPRRSTCAVGRAPITQPSASWSRRQRVNVVGRNDAGNWLAICCPASTDAHRLGQRRVHHARPAQEPPHRRSAPYSQPASACRCGVGGQRQPQRRRSRRRALPWTCPPPAASVRPRGSIPLLASRPMSAAGVPSSSASTMTMPARPQLGTGQADVVYEYLMEGYGITRFSAIFYRTVRSPDRPRAQRPPHQLLHGRALRRRADLFRRQRPGALCPQAPSALSLYGHRPGRRFQHPLFRQHRHRLPDAAAHRHRHDCAVGWPTGAWSRPASIRGFTFGEPTRRRRARHARSASPILAAAT